MKLLHASINGAKINGRKPRLDDFLPQKKRTAKGQAALLKAQALVAAKRAEAIAKRSK